MGARSRANAPFSRPKAPAAKAFAAKAAPHGRTDLWERARARMPFPADPANTPQAIAAKRLPPA